MPPIESMIVRGVSGTTRMDSNLNVLKFQNSNMFKILLDRNHPFESLSTMASSGTVSRRKFVLFVRGCKSQDDELHLFFTLKTLMGIPFLKLGCD